MNQMEWTDEVDDLISSILMYGNLEQTIDGNTHEIR